VLLKLSIKCQKRTDGIFSLDPIFQSSEKSKKIQSFDYETFDQLKKHNFDQVNFGQTTPVDFVRYG